MRNPNLKQTRKNRTTVESDAAGSAIGSRRLDDAHARLAARDAAHGHDHGEHGHAHDDEHESGLLGKLSEWVPFLHGHKHGDITLDAAIEGSERGIQTLKLSLVILGATALFQVVIVLASGSVALLADTVHNLTDAMTAVPLWIAFMLGRRDPTRRFTYGYGRAEDIAGVFILLVILSSAIFAAYESYDRIVNPHDLDNIPWVIVAAIVGFIGNEVVAVLRINTGNAIGSAALVADGQHARVDGLTSLAVLVGALGVAAGFELADPIIGMIISVAILFIAKDVAMSMVHRMMDAVEPSLVEELEHVAEDAARGLPGVRAVSDLRVRWLGHALQSELSLTVDGKLSTRQSHDYAEEVRHAMFHAKPQLTSIIIHVEPDGSGDDDPHFMTAHHGNRAATRATEPHQH